LKISRFEMRIGRKKGEKALNLPQGKAMGRFMVRLIGQAEIMVRGVGKTAANFACLGQDFLSCLLRKGEHQFLMFNRTQVGDIALLINKNHRDCRP